ncbi:topoisomerase DNA-binding C4 zinc finger domain-containing protein, partial [Candidatus Woesearchaeota archaeon]|nr:topoisomerase DNA-binding C4 zinc finger domain-containing protein [Candidatus Woesearchaeota archaeon]
TLAAAQNLYVEGLISYPRTSSQKLPKEIGYEKILNELLKQDFYRELAQKLLDKKVLKPNEGKKTDPAHPAIFPTGHINNISGNEARVYDLIVRRFLACFSEEALRETVKINIDVNKEIFIAKGTRTVEPGWHLFYGPHVKIEEAEMPDLSKGDEILVESIDMLDKETQPPRRYTPASIIKELEKRNLGTKSTRAAIVDALYQRGYVLEKAIQATDIGIRTCEILEKYSPSILDEELTRDFEMEMEKIREGKEKSEEVLEKAKKVLTKILKTFKEKEKDIGKELAKATIETRDEVNYIGPCPVCKKGDLSIRRGKFGRFIACTKYPECKTTFSLPARGRVKSLRQACEQCTYPMISIQMGRKPPQNICTNPNCPSKQIKKEQETIEKNCPKCSKPLVLRKSIYGSFYGCSGYPKCRYTEKIEE